MHQYDWLTIISGIQDALFLSQSDMAERLQVSQQAVSAWFYGKANPSRKVQRNILEIAAKHGIMAKPADPAMIELERFVSSTKGREFVKIMNLYSRMSPMNDKKFLRYAERLVE